MWRPTVLVAWTLTAACAPGDPPPTTSADTLARWAPTVIENVRLFDGEEVVPSATVVLADGRIRQIALPGEPVDTPDGAVAVDGAGKTLLPGLLDGHTHTFNDNYLKAATAWGVTAHFDMFTGDLAFLAAKQEQQRTGASADRPDLFSAGTLVTTAGGHGTQYGIDIPTLDDAGEAESFIDDRLAEGSDYIKIVLEDGSAFGMSTPSLDEERLVAAVRAAHARDVLAVVHVGTYAEARMAIESGADGLVHISSDAAPDPDFGAWAAEHGVFVVPTLTVIESTAGGGPAGASLVEDDFVRPRLDPALEENLLFEFPMQDGNIVDMAHAYESVRLLHEAGVPIVVGSDGPNPGTALGLSIHREMEILVEEVGFTPVEALRAATSVTAEAFELEPWRGRIVEGGRADVVLVDGDPTADIVATRRIEAIWKEGRRWQLESYRETITAKRAERGG